MPQLDTATYFRLIIEFYMFIEIIGLVTTKLSMYSGYRNWL